MKKENFSMELKGQDKQRGYAMRSFGLTKTMVVHLNLKRKKERKRRSFGYLVSIACTTKMHSPAKLMTDIRLRYDSEDMAYAKAMHETVSR